MWHFKTILKWIIEVWASRHFSHRSIEKITLETFPTVFIPRRRRRRSARSHQVKPLN